MSLLGLVRHMAEVERSWFRRRLAGEDAPPSTADRRDEDGDFDDVDTADAEADFATYARRGRRARAVAGGAVARRDVLPRQRDEVDLSVRWVYVHMIEEYARHNGHADLLRERIE